MGRSSRLLSIFLLSIVPFTSTKADRNKLSPDVERGEISFQLYGGFLIVVPGCIGGKGEFHFAIDTGATYSVLDERLARKIAVPTQAGQVFSFDRLVPARWVKVAELQVGPLSAKGLPMQVNDLTYLKALGGPVDAVIGLDLLRGSVFGIDYVRKKIIFGGGQQLRFAVPMKVGPGFVTIEVQVGDRSARVLLDTGARGMLLYEDHLGSELMELPTRAQVSAHSIAGQLDVREVIAPRIRLGNIDLNRAVLLMNGPAPHTVPPIDGYLGTASLGRHVNFDFPQNTLTWSN